MTTGVSATSNSEVTGADNVCNVNIRGCRDPSGHPSIEETYLSAQILEASLLGLGMEVRLERHAWLMNKRVGQTANVYPPKRIYGHCFGISVRDAFCLRRYFLP